ncbi:hypothetical protein HDK77DRAFT_160532 [Phyllosticta capitalensis]
MRPSSQLASRRVYYLDRERPQSQTPVTPIRLQWVLPSGSLTALNSLNKFSFSSLKRAVQAHFSGPSRLSELGYELNSALPPEWTSRYHLWEGVVHLTIEWDDLCRWMVNRRFESWSKMLVSRPPKPYCVSTFVGSNKPEEDLWPLCQDDHESEYLDGTVPLGEAIAMCYITGQRALDEIPTMPWNSGWDDDEHAVACSCRIVNSIALDRLMDKNGHVPPDEDELQEIRRWERVFLGLEAVDEGASPP